MNIDHIILKVTEMVPIIALLFSIWQFSKNLRSANKTREKDLKRAKNEKLADEYKEFIFDLSMFYKKGCLLKEIQIFEAVSDSNISTNDILLPYKVEYDLFGAKVQASMNVFGAIVDSKVIENKEFIIKVNEVVASVHDIMRSTNGYFCSDDSNCCIGSDRVQAKIKYHEAVEKYRKSFSKMKDSFELVVND